MQKILELVNIHKMFEKDKFRIFSLFLKIDMNKNFHINPLNANPTKWSNTLKQFVGKFGV